MRRHVIWMTAIGVLLAAAAEAQPQRSPGIVTLGPAGAGSREIGFSYALWSINADGEGSAAAARYTYNFNENFGLEGGADIGSLDSRPFAAASAQLRVTPFVNPVGPSKFFTLGVVGAGARKGSPVPSGFGRSLGVGLQGPLSGHHALRLEIQVIMFGGWNGNAPVGLRAACTFVTGRD